MKKLTGNSTGNSDAQWHKRGGVAGRLGAPLAWGLAAGGFAHSLLLLSDGQRISAIFWAVGAGLVLKVASDWSRPGGLS